MTNFERLLARSSLGTEGARALIARTPAARARRVMATDDEERGPVAVAGPSTPQDKAEMVTSALGELQRTMEGLRQIRDASAQLSSPAVRLASAAVTSAVLGLQRTLEGLRQIRDAPALRSGPAGRLMAELDGVSENLMIALEFYKRRDPVDEVLVASMTGSIELSLGQLRVATYAFEAMEEVPESTRDPGR